MAKGFLIIAMMTAVLAVMVGGSLSSEQPAVRTVPQPTVVIDGSAGEASSEAQTVSEDGVVELERSADGHFYANVEINGATVRALIDTGASAIALSREDALSAAVPTSIGMPNVVGRGADGEVFGEQVMLDRVALGHQTAENMPAIVLNSGEQTLLGQSFLSQFGLGRDPRRQNDAPLAIYIEYR